MTAAAFAEGGLTEAAQDHLVEPHDADEAGPAETEPAHTPGGTALKVLYVDDEEDFVRTMAERMEMRALGGEVALSGEAALRMIEGDVPDVMVLDLRMPGLDGLEVLRRVKATYPQVEVIVMTGRGTDQDEEEAKKLGAFAYLTKPVDINALMETVRAAGRTRHATT